MVHVRDSDHANSSQQAALLLVSGFAASPCGQGQAWLSLAQRVGYPGARNACREPLTFTMTLYRSMAMRTMDQMDVQPKSEPAKPYRSQMSVPGERGLLR